MGRPLTRPPHRTQTDQTEKQQQPDFKLDLPFSSQKESQRETTTIAGCLSAQTTTKTIQRYNSFLYLSIYIDNQISMTNTTTTAPPPPPVGEPVWYYREDKETWWPAVKFPNVWTAYAVCHDQHLSSTSTTSSDAELADALFQQWTSFCLEATVQHKHDKPVLAKLERGPHLELALLDDNQDDDNNNNNLPLRSFHQVTPTGKGDDFVQAVKHLMVILASKANRQQIIGPTTTTGTANNPSSTITHAATTTTTTTAPQATQRPPAVTPRAPSSGPTTNVSPLSRASTLPTSNKSPSVSVATVTTTAASLSQPPPPPQGGADAIPRIDGEPIHKHEPWERVWRKLEYSLFTQRPSARGTIYVKPRGKRENPQDVFASLKELQAFCRRSYGWEGPVEEEEEASTSSSSEEEEEANDTAISDIESEDEESLADNSTIRTKSVHTHRPNRVSMAHSPAVSAMTNHTTMTPVHAANNNKAATTPSDGDDDEEDDDGDSVASDSTIAANRYWKTMREEGWGWCKGHSGIDWHVVAPGCKNRAPYINGKDYFDTTLDAYLYCTNRPPRQLGRRKVKPVVLPPTTKATTARATTAKSRAATNLTMTPVNQPTVPQDPAKPLPMSACSRASSSSESSVDSVASDSTTAANRYWPTMKANGWKNINGHSGHVWHWIAPGRGNTPEYTLGKDYFGSLLDAYLYETNRPARVLGKGTRRRAAAKGPEPQKNNNTKKKNRSAVSPTGTVATKRSTLTAKFERVKSNSSRKVSSKQPKATPPKWAQIRGILAAYCNFELHSRSQVSRNGIVMSDMMTALVLLRQGIPARKTLASTGKEPLVLDWLRHALVWDPKVDFDLTSFHRSDNRQLKTALTALGISFQCGKIFLPGAPPVSTNQIHREHFFEEDELETLLASWVRTNFTELVPANPSVSQLTSLAQVGKWLSCIDHMELPTFKTLPKQSNSDFWNVMHHAEAVLTQYRKKSTGKKNSENSETQSVASSCPSLNSATSGAKVAAPFWTEDQIKSILRTLGYKELDDGRYRHDKMEKTWESLEELREFLPMHGVYDYSTLKKRLDKPDREAFFKWQFVRLVTPEEYGKRSLLKVKDDQAWKLLGKGGWCTVDGQWYHPDACGNRRPGIDRFENMDEVALQVAMNSDALKQDRLSEQEILQLRMWALNPAKLQKDYQVAQKRRRESLELGEVMLLDKPLKRTKPAPVTTQLETTIVGPNSRVLEVEVVGQFRSYMVPTRNDESQQVESSNTMPQPTCTVHDIEVAVPSHSIQTVESRSEVMVVDVTSEQHDPKESAQCDTVQYVDAPKSGDMQVETSPEQPGRKEDSTMDDTEDSHEEGTVDKENPMPKSFDMQVDVSMDEQLPEGNTVKEDVKDDNTQNDATMISPVGALEADVKVDDAAKNENDLCDRVLIDDDEIVIDAAPSDRGEPVALEKVDAMVDNPAEKNEQDDSDKIFIDDDGMTDTAPNNKKGQSLSLELFTVSHHEDVSDKVMISDDTEEAEAYAGPTTEPNEPAKEIGKEIACEGDGETNETLWVALDTKTEVPASCIPPQRADAESPGSAKTASDSSQKRRGTPPAAPPCALVRMFTPEQEEKKEAGEAARTTTGLHDQHLLTQHEQDGDDDCVSFPRGSVSNNVLEGDDENFVDDSPAGATGDGNLPLLTQPDRNDDDDEGEELDECPTATTGDENLPLLTQPERNDGVVDDDDDGHSCGSVIYRDTMMPDNDHFCWNL
eukprot:scaffold14698_cov196-Amphora_coffeaeformis.AAC.4